MAPVADPMCLKLMPHLPPAKLTAFEYVFYLRLPVASHIFFQETKLFKPLRKHTKSKPKPGSSTAPEKLTAQGNTPPIFLSLN